METVTVSPRDNQRQSKAFHQATLDALGAPNGPFYSKMAFCPTSVGLTEKHIGFFENEIASGQDVFIEFGNKEMLPEKVEGYPLKCLLKWRYNAHYREEYTPSLPDPKTGHVRYFIPITELVVVSKSEKAMLKTSTAPEVPERESKVNELVIHPDESDPSFKDMTIRDYAAIHMKKPVSKKAWLNELILKHP